MKLLATPEALPGARILLTYSHTQSKMPGSELIRGPDFRKRQDLTGFAAIFRTNVDALTAKIRDRARPRCNCNCCRKPREQRRPEICAAWIRPDPNWRKGLVRRNSAPLVA